MSFESLLIDQGEIADIVDETVVGVTYMGWCLAGTTATNQAKFKIKRVSANAGITITEYAGGNRDYSKIWDNRVGLQYSFLK
jgi:hypothetical protein